MNVGPNYKLVLCLSLWLINAPKLVQSNWFWDRHCIYDNKPECLYTGKLFSVLSYFAHIAMPLTFRKGPIDTLKIIRLWWENFLVANTSCYSKILIYKLKIFLASQGLTH